MDTQTSLPRPTDAARPQHDRLAAVVEELALAELDAVDLAGDYLQELKVHKTLVSVLLTQVAALTKTVRRQTDVIARQRDVIARYISVADTSHTDSRAA